MTKGKILLLLLVFIVLTCLGYAFASTDITGIDVRETDGVTEIVINATAPLNYTVYKPSDPYLVVVELQDVGLGRFTEKMVVDRAGVMEITPSMVEGREGVVRLEIALTVPADVKPTQKDNSLLLSFVNPEEGVAEGEGTKKAKRIESIDFLRKGDRLLVKFKGDGIMSPLVSQFQKNKLIIDIPDVTSSIEAPKVYEPPMAGIRIGTYPEKTRVVIDLMESTEYDIASQGNEVIISLKSSIQKPPAVTKAEAQKKVEAQKPEVIVEKEPICDSEKGYVGEKISIDFQDAELVHIFRLIADVSGCNIVVSPEVIKKKEKFTMRLKDVPWTKALDIILRNYGLSKRVEDNIIRIAPTSDVAKEEKEIADRKEAELMSGDLITRSYQINYSDVKDIKKAIEDISQRKGGGIQRTSISIDERTSTIIIRDVEKMHEAYAQIIETLDKPIPQVIIEARIVEASTNFTRELGIQWGADIRLNPNMKIGGVNELIGGKGFTSGNPLLVNLPAPATGAIGFGYIGAGSLRALDLQLSAMEITGKGKIVSNPKIVTTDNQKAKIQQGKKIPYQTVSSEGTQTQFVDATLELSVTPHITPSGAILMDVETKKNEADFGQTVGGVPTIDTKEAKTKVLINNGDTLVIGGIFKTNTSWSESYVPLLGRIPVLGWLFKKRKVVDDTTELLIFLTPRIIEQQPIAHGGG
ncbi:MAG: type IV pilus secretin PilQ [Thermodesulfovibrionia bacterium]